MCINRYFNELITKRKYVTQEAKSCYSDNRYLSKKGLQLIFKPGYLISWHETEAQHRVSELVNSGEKEGKENEKLRENVEMSILSEEESVYRARTAVPNSVDISHMGLFK